MAWFRSGLAGRAIRTDARRAGYPKREKVRESMEKFAFHFRVFLLTDLHFLQFEGRFGQIVPGPKNIASPPLACTLLPSECNFVFTIRTENC